MLKRLIVISTMTVLLSGCYMVPMAFIGPVSSGFTTASIIQSTVTTSASYMVKKSTGKTIQQHAFDAISNKALVQTYLPADNAKLLAKIHGDAELS